MATNPSSALAAFSAGLQNYKRRQQTGVDPGGQGYVSGQVDPSQQTQAPGQTPTSTSSGASGDGSIAGALGLPTSAPTSTGPVGRFGNLGAFGGTTTTSSALTTGAPAPSGGGGAGGGAAPGTTGAGKTGTAPGYSPLGPLAGPVNSIPVVGPIITGLTSTSTADLSPTLNAQNAAFGTAQNLNQERYDYRPGAAPFQERVALDAAAQNEIRQRQLGALDALTGAANGTVPSAAEIQLRQQAARNNAANLGAARALGGRSAGGAAHAATVANAEANAATNVNAAQVRAAEQASARAALVGALSGTRGQDIDLASTNANLNQAANANNLGAQLKTDELADAHRLALLKAQLDAMGIGTQAGGYTVSASAKNAAAENATKGGIVSGIASKFGL